MAIPSSSQHLKAVIDIGSLKVKVAIFDTKQKKLLSSQSIMTLLGKGIAEQHHIVEESIERLKEALQHVANELKAQRITDIVIIGTEALRSADNAAAVHELVATYFSHHHLEVIDQEKEADLFFTAVSREFPDQDILAMDIGGGSVQLIYGHYNSQMKRTSIRKKYNLKTGTYRLQQRYSPNNEEISKDFALAQKVVAEAFNEITHTAPILVFGSTCMRDFIESSGVPTRPNPLSNVHPIHITKNAVERLLEDIRLLAPNKRDHYFPTGGYFMYGADYLLLNLVAAIQQSRPQKIYPTNLNSAYALI